MIKKLILLPALALSLAFSPTTFAGHHKAHPCNCMQMQKMVKELNLTKDQQTKIKAIRDKNKPAMQAKREEVRTLTKEINALSRTDKKMDNSKLNSLVSKKQAILGEMMKTRANTKHEIYNTLTTEQRAKFTAMMEKWEQKNAANLLKKNDITG